MQVNKTFHMDKCNLISIAHSKVSVLCVCVDVC